MSEIIFYLIRSEEGRFIFTFAFIFFSCLLVAFGYFIGNLNSIRDDLKSLDYDRIKMENEQLNRTIELKRRNRNHGGKRKSR